MLAGLSLVACALVATPAPETNHGLPSTIRDALRFLRERAGLSARQLSQQAGLSPSYVAKVESGILVPSLIIFSDLVQALALSPYEVWTLVRNAATRPTGVTPETQDAPGA